MRQLQDWKAEIESPAISADRLAAITEKIRPYSNDGGEVQVLWAIATHPNCPPRTFASLLEWHPIAACENLAWDLLVLEGILPYLTRDRLMTQLLSAELPKRYVELICSHPDRFLRDAAEEHIAVAGEVEGDLREALLSKLATLCRDGRLVWLARFGLLPEVLNVHLPYRVLPSQTRQRLVKTGILPQACPTPEQWKIARSKGTKFLMAKSEMAHDPKTPQEILEFLAEEYNGVALNPSASLSVVLRHWYSREVGMVSSNPWGALRIAHRLLREEELSDEQFQEAFLLRCAMSKAQLASVIAVSQINESCWLEHLGNRPCWKKRLGAALNPRALTTPITTFFNGDVKTEVLIETLANDGNRWVRAVARQRLADPSWRLF